MEEKIKLYKKQIIILIILIMLIALISSILFINYKKHNVYTGVLAKMMSYPKVEAGEKAIEGTDVVTFDAFFLQDLDGDGYVEGIRGNAIQIGEHSELYIELNVLPGGFLMEGTIEINSDNFYFQTAIPRDNEIKENAIGNNIKQIKLNNISSGTTKSLSGMVCSGEGTGSTKTVAIGNDTNKYCKTNSIIFKGKIIDTDGKEKDIEKTVEFDVDWYGTTKAEIPNSLGNKSNLNQHQSIEGAIDEENNEFKTEYNIIIQEVNNELILNKSCIETEIPQLNGHSPTKVEVIGNNLSYSYYDKETRKLVAYKEAKIDENGIVTSQAYDGIYYNARYNEFKVIVTYPLEAYKDSGETNIYQELDVKGYYEGFNNKSEEFTNPYKSNVATEKITLNIDNHSGNDIVKAGSYIGKRVYNPRDRYVVSKENMLKVYNGISNTSIENTYVVNWNAHTGIDGNTPGLLLEEASLEESKSDVFIKKDNTRISMEDITNNIGIYFSNPSVMLDNDGWIKIFDAETNELIETFTSKDWSQYTSSNPYKYKRPINHIKIETSSTKNNASLSIYHIKNIDTKYVTENISKEEFDKIKQIETYVKITTLVGTTYYYSSSWAQANYEAPYAKADLELSQSALSTQETKNNMEITIKAEGNINNGQVMWLNGVFLLKLPKEILGFEINKVTPSKEDVKILSIGEEDDDEGYKFIKINTANSTPTTFNIVVDCNITPDPRIGTKSDSIILYSYNEAAVDYWPLDTDTYDIYDINDNLNKDEEIGMISKNINLVSPTTMLTNETVTSYDEKGSITVSPQIAVIAKSQKTAEINIEIKNNSGPVSDIVILGRVPFKDNKYVISGKDLESNFSVQMTTGISIPEELAGKVEIYYSKNEDATNNLSESSNGWTTTPRDFSEVKSYLIVFKDDYIFEKNKSTQFSYTINMPENINYNQVSYSHHAIYFSLHMQEGKYRTQLESNKVGLMIGKEYDLDVTKCQKGRDDVFVAGATYSITEEGKEEGKTRVTDINGKLILKNLYVDRTYIVKEIKSPSSYELNTDEIKFKTIEKDGKLELEEVVGNKKKIEILEPDSNNGYRVQLQVEDEVKPSLKIIKTEKGTNTGVNGVYFKITGEGLPDTGRGLITNNDGEVILNGLHIGTEYTLEEIKATGYYLENPIKFVIENNNGNYSINIIEGNIAGQTITEIDSIPTINLNIENTKIPTYNLQINKVVKGETTPIAGVKFRLFKGKEKIGDYETDTNGTIIINNLYQYEADRDIEQTYTLKETFAPDGFSVVNDITFKVENVKNVENNEDSLMMTVLEGKIKEQSASGNTISVTIEDSTSFKLIKKDGEDDEVLPGTKFVIYDIIDGTAQTAYDSKGNILGTKETIDGRDYYTLTTNEKGEITASLKEGLYKAIEVQTSSDKYELTNDEYFFGIGATREAVLERRIDLYDQIGGTGNDNIISMSKSKTLDGGMYVGGTFQNSIQLSEKYKIESAGDSDVIIIKYNNEGEILWYKQFGGSGKEDFGAITATSDGGVVVGIKVRSEVKLENGNTKSNGLLLIKYLADRNFRMD